MKYYQLPFINTLASNTAVLHFDDIEQFKEQH